MIGSSNRNRFAMVLMFWLFTDNKDSGPYVLVTYGEQGQRQHSEREHQKQTRGRYVPVIYGERGQRELDQQQQ